MTLPEGAGRYRAEIMPNIALLLLSLSFALGQSTTTCPVEECYSVAYSAIGCSADYLECLCESASVKHAISSCMFSGSPACANYQYHHALTELSSSCTSRTRRYSSVASDLCDECFANAAPWLSCIDGTDYACLCQEGRSTLLPDFFRACARRASSVSASCGKSAQDSILRAFTSSCSSYVALSSSPGCLACQSEVATGLSCRNVNDFSCLCGFDDAYSFSISRCISTNAACPSSDFTHARDTYTSACAAVSTGGIPPHLTATGSGRLESIARETSRNSDVSGSPNGLMVAGITVSVLLALFALCLGGYFIFRRRKSSRDADAQDSSAEPTGQEGQMTQVEAPDNAIHELSPFLPPAELSQTPGTDSPSHLSYQQNQELSELPGSGGEFHELDGSRQASSPVEAPGTAARAEVDRRVLGDFRTLGSMRRS